MGAAKEVINVYRSHKRYNCAYSIISYDITACFAVKL